MRPFLFSPFPLHFPPVCGMITVEHLHFFGKAAVITMKQATVIILAGQSNAVGGTSLWRDWLSPSSGGDYDPEACAASPEEAVNAINHGRPLPAGWCYNELVRLTRESLTLLVAAGYTPLIRGFCWMQGEADACDAATLELYGERFDNLLRDFAETFAPYTAECVTVDAGISEVWPLYREMNVLKAHCAAARGGVYLDTVAHGLTTKTEPEGAVDIYHYDCGSAVELGRMFAEALTGAWN